MSDSDPLRNWPHRVLAVFFSPGSLFEQLRHKPAWGGPAFLVVVLGLLTDTVLVMEYVNYLRDIGQELRSTASPYVLVVGGTLIRTGIICATAGFMFFVFGTLLGDNGRYEQYLSVTVHAFIVTTIGSLLSALLNSSLGFALRARGFLPFPDDGFLGSLLSRLDNPFTFWTVVLAALGASKIHPNRSWRSALAVLVVGWIVFAAGIEVAPL